MQANEKRTKRSMTLANPAGEGPCSSSDGASIPAPATAPTATLQPAMPPPNSSSRMSFQQMAPAQAARPNIPVPPDDFMLDAHTIQHVRCVMEQHAAETGWKPTEPLTDDTVKMLTQRTVVNLYPALIQAAEGSAVDADQFLANYSAATAITAPVLEASHWAANVDRTTADEVDRGSTRIKKQLKKDLRKAIRKKRKAESIIVPAGNGEVVIKEEYAASFLDMVATYEPLWPSLHQV